MNQVRVKKNQLGTDNDGPAGPAGVGNYVNSARQGTAIGVNGTFPDSCSGTILTEYLCGLNNAVESTTVDCNVGGQRCEDGACK